MIFDGDIVFMELQRTTTKELATLEVVWLFLSLEKYNLQSTQRRKSSIDPDLLLQEEDAGHEAEEETEEDDQSSQLDGNSENLMIVGIRGILIIWQ